MSTTDDDVHLPVPMSEQAAFSKHSAGSPLGAVAGYIHTMYACAPPEGSHHGYLAACYNACVDGEAEIGAMRAALGAYQTEFGDLPEHRATAAIRAVLPPASNDRGHNMIISQFDPADSLGAQPFVKQVIYLVRIGAYKQATCRLVSGVVDMGLRAGLTMTAVGIILSNLPNIIGASKCVGWLGFVVAIVGWGQMMVATRNQSN